MVKVYVERTPWHDDGFATKPTEREAEPGDILYRAYSETSKVWGRFFFVPAINDVPINYWTAELLEKELNAALWGNEYDGIATFQIVYREPKVKYQIGSIAHDLYAGKDGEANFVQRSFITPSGIFKQVKLVMGADDKLTSYVKRIGELIPIRADRFSREMTKRAKKFNQ